jgi:hypothetical protein
MSIVDLDISIHHRIVRRLIPVWDGKFWAAVTHATIAILREITIWVTFGWSPVTEKFVWRRIPLRQTSTHPSGSCFLSSARGRRFEPRPNLHLLPEPLSCRQMLNWRLHGTLGVAPKHLFQPLWSSLARALVSFPTTWHLHAQIKHCKELVFVHEIA